MDSTEGKGAGTDSDDEEDTESYFLQPASSPYNLTEKVKQANDELNNHNVDLDNKQSKIRFREELVDYEPESPSCDDIISVESDANIDYALLENDTIVFEEQLQSQLILKVFDINDCLLEEDEIEEEDVEEILEELDGSDVQDELITPDQEIDSTSEILDIENQHFDEHKLVNELRLDLESPESKTTLKTTKKRFNRIKKSSLSKETILCSRHCVENVERLDINSNICVRKLNLTEKPQMCPRLKLQRRSCCENNELKIHQKLPQYDGLRSEYGLNANQLEKRERTKEFVTLKAEEKKRRIEEKKLIKINENEKVYCDWLKKVNLRKKPQTGYNDRPQKKQTVTPMVDSKRNDTSNTLKQRPITANELKLKNLTKKTSKRPNTGTFANVFIEVPRVVIRKGVAIGDIFVKENTVGIAKRLQLFSLK